jgi:cell shape-determining protein MreC
MSTNQFTSPSKRTVFALLMAGSALMLALPYDYLRRPAGEMVQLIAYPQWAVQQATLKAKEPFEALARQQITAGQQAQLEEENKGLENENVVLRQQIETLKQTINELTLLRGNGFPSQGLLVPADVVAADAAPREDSFVISKGKARGVKHQDWVASRLFVQAGDRDGVSRDAAVLARQCLIGWVEQTASFTSRVVLLSDPAANRGVRVHIAHHDPQTRQPLQVLWDDRIAEFVLQGAGGGKMIIRDIKNDFVKAGYIAEGDLVLSDAHDPRLGQSLVIGEIELLRHNKDKPLLYDAIVRYRFDPHNLSEVLIVDRSRTGSAPR